MIEKILDDGWYQMTEKFSFFVKEGYIIWGTYERFCGDDIRGFYPCRKTSSGFVPFNCLATEDNVKKIHWKQIK